MFSDLISKFKTKLNSSEHNHRHNRSIKDVFKFRKVIAVIVSVVLTCSVTLTYAAPQYYDVAVVDGDNFYEFSTPRTTVADLLARRGIEVTDYDIVSPDLDTYIKGSRTIVIERVSKVTLVDGGKATVCLTTADTVADLIDEKGIKTDSDDIINLADNYSLKDNTKLEIIRVTKSSFDYDTAVPYSSSTVKDPSMSVVDTKILTQGVNGVDRHKYEVIYHNGVEVSRDLISTQRISNPVNEVKAVGTREVKYTSNGSFSYSKKITCTATAYDLSFASCGKRPGDRGYGITASGTYAKYGTVAVDPRVIPLGTKMYIETSDGSIVYGYCTAEDTGGAIKGNKVDLFYPSNSQCMQFGRRSVNVYILD